VIGDFLAAGLAEALPEALEENATVEIERKTRNASGFARPDRYDWSARIRSLLKDGDMHIAVVMLGSNDRRRIRTAQGFKDFGTEAWAQAYKARVDSIIEQFKQAKVAVYWMGLPITRKRRLNEHMQTVNEILRERTRRQQAKFIGTWQAFTDEKGGYAVFGADATGRMRRLRAGNGFHFTGRGYVELARLVHPEIAFDLAHAQSERNVELVGKPPIATDHVTRSVREPDAGRAETGGNAFDLAITPAGGLDDGEATPTVAEAGGSGESAEKAGGPAADDTRSVMLKVLLRGEKIEAKPGRADDFSWPPQP